MRLHRVIDPSGKRQLATMKLQVHGGELGNYDFILGRDCMKRCGIDLKFSSDEISWAGRTMPMHPPGCWNNERLADFFFVHENPQIEDALNGDCMHCDDLMATALLGSEHEKQDLQAVTAAQEHLTPDQRQQLHRLLQRHESLFSGKLSAWKGAETDVDLDPTVPPCHCRRPIRMPHICMDTLRQETERLCRIGVVEKTKGWSAWCAPSFAIPKKDRRIRFITDCRQLNKVIRGHPWPVPHVADIVQTIGKHKHATCLDLSMGCYHLKLSKRTSDLTTFMLPFGCCKCLRLPMGFNIGPDEFQRSMTTLLLDLPFVHCCLDDMAIITNGACKDHLRKLGTVLARFERTGLAVNALKSHWAADREVEHLGFLLAPNGIRPQPQKIKAIQDLQSPRDWKQSRRIVGLVNCYRHMWRRRSHLLAPLTHLLSAKRPFVWTPLHQHAFEQLKGAITKEVLLSFPDCSEPFHLCTDASKCQLGAVLTQEKKPIAFFSRKLNTAQQNCNVAEKEALAIIETLREFRSVPCGYPVVIHTDHQNLTHDAKPCESERVCRWRMAVEEFMPTVRWVPGEKNPVADLLSRHPTVSPEATGLLADENFDNQPFDFRSAKINLACECTVPLNLKEICKAQIKDPAIIRLQRESPASLGTAFDNAGEREPHHALTAVDPVLKESRIIVPKIQRNRLLHWHHHMLMHPGTDRLCNTLHQHCCWPSMRKDAQCFVKTCLACQKGKHGLRGCGKIPLEEVETQPWKDMCCDLAGPWKAAANNKTVAFHSLAMIDPFTSWVEIVPVFAKEAPCMRDQIPQQWPRRHPRPSRTIFDQGGEFDNSWMRASCKRWNVRPTPVTVKNLRANAIVERMHKIMGDMSRCDLTRKHKNDRPAEDMLAACACGIRAAAHGTAQCTPGQLVFSKDMMLRTHVEADFEMVRLRRRKAAEANNLRENKRRIKHNCKKGDRVMIIADRLDPKLKVHEGPFKVVACTSSSGTLQIRRGNFIEPINIRLVRPCFGRHSGGD